MAAGQGFKTFTTGEVLTAADVNGYLMQGVLVFASEAARDAAITSPQEGQFAYTKDNNSLWYYTGSAWAASGATGDIEGVTAGVGISGGGTSGTVTITNSMATEIAAKGDLIVGTGSQTFDNLTVGANNTVLTADSSTATGLKWATTGGSSFQGAKAVKNANQSLSNATSTALTFEVELFDAGGYFTTGSNTRMTIPTGKGGYYVVIAQVGYANGASNTSREAWLRVNGSDVRNQTYTVGMNMTRPQMVYAVDVLSLNAADYVEVIGYQDTGGSLNVINDGNDMSYFAIYYLGA